MVVDKKKKKRNPQPILFKDQKVAAVVTCELYDILSW